MKIRDGGFKVKNIKQETKEQSIPEYHIEQGEIVVTKNVHGQIVAVTRQDQDGKILKVIAESMKNNMNEALVSYELNRQLNNTTIQNLMHKDFQDEDGYPTEAALTIIKLWDFEDKKGWFAFIKDLWYYKSWGWNQDEADPEYDNGREVYVYEISTAGWSGNESLISAMQDNWGLWAMTWVQSRRGGHYIFERELE